jgi:hypothetical protein
MIRIRYRVHSCVRDTFAVEASIAGQVKTVTVEGLIVEAVSEDGSMGHLFKIHEGDMAELEARYSAGAVFTLGEVAEAEGGDAE